VWLPRLVTRVLDAAAPVVLVGGEQLGVPFIVDALREAVPVAWFELDRLSEDDAVAQGNGLARAVNQALPAPLLASALPYRSHLAGLRRYQDDLAPLTFAITLESLGSAFVGEMLDLHGDGYRVVLDARTDSDLPDAVVRRCDVIDARELRLTRGEALELAPASLPEQVVEALWRDAHGAFTEFMAAAHRAVRLPRLNVPSAAGPLVDVRDGALVEPRTAVQMLQREGDLAGALELAVLRAPELVDELLRLAGPRLQEEGMLQRLHLLLSALPEQYAKSERVLEWRLVAGTWTNDYADVFADVDAYLETHTAPALRARRAGTLAFEAGFAMAEQAVEARRSALTVWQYGRLHPNPATAVSLLRESVQLAEDHGSRHEVARNAGALAARLAQQGEYARASSWARWALDMFDREHLHDGPRRLLLVNDLAHARIMTGDLVGLRSGLEDAQALVEGTLPQLAVLLRSTRAQLELAEGDPGAATALAGATYHASPRRSRARYGFQYVRTLLETDRLDEAWEVAHDVSETSALGEAHERAQAALARGMVAAVAARKGTGGPHGAGGRGRRAGPASAGPDVLSDLLEALLQPALPAEQRLTAALYYLLASDGAAHNIPIGVAPILSSLHPVALRVLSGPAPLFEHVWATLSGPPVELSITFLGEVECRWQGRDIGLSQRLSEVALALVLHPEGISRDVLNTFLTPDSGVPFTSGGMRGMMTRLRSVLPVSDAPYRFTVPVTADVLEVREFIAAGKVREAVGLLKGALLPHSEAPGVVEQRWALEEELRQAALLVGDADALFELAERLGDDLEFWQAAADALGSGDPRLALARARVRRLVETYELGF